LSWTRLSYTATARPIINPVPGIWGGDHNSDGVRLRRESQWGSDVGLAPFGLLVTPTTVTSYFDDKPMAASQYLSMLIVGAAVGLDDESGDGLGMASERTASQALRHVDQGDSAVSLTGVPSRQAT